MSNYDSREQVLAAVNAGNLTVDQAVEELAKLDSANAPGRRRAFTMKVTEKGALGLRGPSPLFNRFGVTQYPACILYILDHGEEIRAFIEEHRSELSWKD